ncbi:hypothetical protein B0H16DRAFT_1893018 [Mycena metata]|uniref:MYND-type domain-containing protein n=1 Tax=Mycena metata TaxID=1033252 RepID=A0AAD7I2Z3_9AGAR|nr:hypothetical protein B0H16DRAFT_1893018 [Mycena metata]
MNCRTPPLKTSGNALRLHELPQARRGKLLRCSKCKGVLYCSTECQAQHWPTHKPLCTSTADSNLIEHVDSALANPFFTLILQACFILQFDLLRSPRIDKPFVGLVDFGIEPVEFSNFSKIFTNQRLGDGEVEAMVQMNSFKPLTSPISPGGQTVWRQAVDRIKDEEHAWSVVLAKISTGGSGVTATSTLTIGRGALDLVRASRPWSFECPSTGTVIERPFNIESCMEFLNDYIRRDNDNAMYLRTKMRASDVKRIRDAKAGATSDAAKLLRAKMRREEIFKSLKEHVPAEIPKMRFARMGDVNIGLLYDVC